MLRNKYLNRYESQKEISIPSEEKEFLVYDENYHLYLERPFNMMKIKKIKPQKLYKFIDEIMCNKKFNFLLYSSNAKKIASYYIKQKKNLLKQYAPSEVDKDNIFTKKTITFAEKIKREKIFEDIKLNIEKFKINKKRCMTQMMEKNEKFIKSQPSIDKKLEKISSKSVNEIRLKGYKRAFNKCLQLSSRNDFKIIDINNNDTFERLYNNYAKKISYNDIMKQKKNEIFSYKILLKNQKNSKRRSISQINLINPEPRKKILKFKLNSNLTQNEHTLNQFNIGVTKKMIRRCLSTLSGGPKKKNKSKEISKINEIKKKFNYRILSFKNKADPDDKSLYNTMIVNDPFLKKYKIKNKNYRDRFNNSSLHIAVNNNSISMVKYFLNKKIKNLNSRNDKGQTPLHVACKLGNEEMINLLIQNGSKINVVDNAGNRPFDLLSSERTSNL